MKNFKALFMQINYNLYIVFIHCLNFLIHLEATLSFPSDFLLPTPTPAPTSTVEEGTVYVDHMHTSLSIINTTHNVSDKNG